MNTGSRRAFLLLGAIGTQACGLVSDVEDFEPSVKYEVEALEVFTETHEWTTVPITYLRAGVRGVNATHDSLHVSMPNCQLDLQAFPGADLARPTDVPAWVLRNRRTWPGGSPFGCLGGIRETFGPGDTVSFTMTPIPLAEILGDSLPHGPYRFRVEVESEVTRGARLRAEPTSADLGVVYLPKSRHPLTLATYPRDGLHYRVAVVSESEPPNDPVARLTVTHTARFSGALTRELSLRCPVRFLAFRTAEEREGIPVPRPVWRWPSLLPGCGDERMPIRLAPGSHWEFETALPRGAYAHTGMEISDFFLLAIIEVDGRPIHLAVDPT